MSPRAQRVAPLYQQIVDHYTEEIRAGRLAPGDAFPTIRAIARDFGVGQQTAQHAVELLTSAKLLVTSQSGTVVAPKRAAYGPQELISATEPGGMLVVRAAELVPASGPYGYVRPILGLRPAIPAPQVIRREWVALDPDGLPAALCVSWADGRYAIEDDPLLSTQPLSAGYLAHAVADRAGVPIVRGEVSCEARQILDDGREAPALGLDLDAHVLATVAKWFGPGDQVLQYLEMAMRENRVLKYVIEP